MVLRGCKHCPWQVDFANDEAADRGEARHALLRHGAQAAKDVQAANLPTVPTPALTGAQWRTRALDAIAILASRGVPFSAFDVAQMGGVGEPPAGPHEWGRLFRDAHHSGLIEQAGWTESQRPTVKASAAKLWRGTGRRVS